MATRPMLVYDGGCGVCTASARWIGERLGDRADVVPWQALPCLGELGLTLEDVERAAWWVEGGRAVPAHLAVGRALEVSGGWRRPLGRTIRTVPGRWLAAPVYRWVAANRHRLPAACSRSGRTGRTGVGPRGGG